MSRATLPLCLMPFERHHRLHSALSYPGGGGSLRDPFHVKRVVVQPGLACAMRLRARRCHRVGWNHSRESRVRACHAPQPDGMGAHRCTDSLRLGLVMHGPMEGIVVRPGA